MFIDWNSESEQRIWTYINDINDRRDNRLRNDRPKPDQGLIRFWTICDRPCDRPGQWPVGLLAPVLTPKDYSTLLIRWASKISGEKTLEDGGVGMLL